MAHFSVKIYLYTHFLLSGRLSTSFEPALRPDPPIRTWLGEKMPSSVCPDKFLKSECRPGPVWTNWAQRRPDKNPIFRIRPFLLLPGVLPLCTQAMYHLVTKLGGVRDFHLRKVQPHLYDTLRVEISHLCRSYTHSNLHFLLSSKSTASK